MKKIRINKTIIFALILLLIIPLVYYVFFSEGSVSLTPERAIKLNSEQDAMYSIIVDYETSVRRDISNRVLHVEDTLPLGLEFVSFIQTNTNSFQQKHRYKNN